MCSFFVALESGEFHQQRPVSGHQYNSVPLLARMK